MNPKANTKDHEMRFASYVLCGALGALAGIVATAMTAPGDDAPGFEKPAQAIAIVDGCTIYKVQSSPDRVYVTSCPAERNVGIAAQ